MTGFPDFYSYCNRCSHQKVCEYFEIFKLFQNIDDDLQELTSDIKDRREIETGEDVNFYGLICLPQPCPYFHEKTSEKEVEQ